MTTHIDRESLHALTRNNDQVVAALAHRALGRSFELPSDSSPVVRTSVGHIMSGTAAEAIDHLRAAGFLT